MTNTVDPGFNIDNVHRHVVAELFDEHGLGGSAEERQAIAQRWHQLDAWSDFPSALRRLRQHRICVSFTILSLSLIVDVSRRNGIDWDAVVPSWETGVRVNPLGHAVCHDDTPGV